MDGQQSNNNRQAAQDAWVQSQLSILGNTHLSLMPFLEVTSDLLLPLTLINYQKIITYRSHKTQFV